MAHCCIADRSGIWRADIPVENDEVRELPNLDRAGLVVEVVDVGAADRERAERGVKAEPFVGQERRDVPRVGGDTSDRDLDLEQRDSPC